MQRVREVNMVYLITVVFMLSAPMIPWSSFTSNATTLLLVSQAIVAAPSLIYMIISKRRYTEVVSFHKLSILNLVLLLFMTAAIMPVMSFVNALSRLFASDVTTGTMTAITMNQPFWVSLLCIAVVPAILEESVYRGMFYNEYRKWNPRAAVFLSALMFGALHGNLNQFSYAFFMGVVFALIIEATDSILSTIFIHFLINGNSVLIMHTISGSNQNAEELLGEVSNVSLSLSSVLATYLVPALIGLTVAFFLYRQIAKNCGRWEHIQRVFTSRSTQMRDIGMGTDASAAGRDRIKLTAIVTWPLLAALLVGIIDMISKEFMY